MTPCTKKPDTVEPDTAGPDMVKKDTIINSSYINSSISNILSIKKSRFKIGMTSVPQPLGVDGRLPVGPGLPYPVDKRMRRGPLCKLLIQPPIDLPGGGHHPGQSCQPH